MLYATARSVREERSRQRYALQDFSILSATLIKGKGGWRIGSIETLMNPFMEAKSRGARGSVVKLTKLLRRYVHGEMLEPSLYIDFVTAVKFASSEPTIPRELLDLYLSVRLLSHLGYTALPQNTELIMNLPLQALKTSDLLAIEDELLSSLRGAQAVSHLES